MDEGNRPTSTAISVRLPPALVDEIDALVATGRFKSRSSCIEQVCLRYLAETDQDHFQRRLIETLQHPEVQRVYREMNTELIQEAITNLITDQLKRKHDRE